MRPNRDSLLIATARLWAQRSTCSRLHVGCVVSNQGRILVQGYNGAPANLPHCDHTCDCGAHMRTTKVRPDNKFDTRKVRDPGHSSECAMYKPCTISVHAEANAIAHAAKVGVALAGAELHSTHAPCYNCCMLIINAGIVGVWYGEEHRDMSGMKLLHDAGIGVMQFSGMIPV